MSLPLKLAWGSVAVGILVLALKFAAFWLTGSIALYVALLPQSGATSPPTTGATVQLVVAGRDTLNAAGILPLALGIPLLLGVITGTLKAVRRRR